MADSDKNIRITTNKNKPTPAVPQIVFTGAAAGASVITLKVQDDNSITFSSDEGTIFSLDNNLTVGTIWSVNDVSATPILRASAGSTVGIAEFGGGLGVGITNPSTTTYKFTVRGQSAFASTNSLTNQFIINTSQATGSNSIDVLGANDLRFYNSANTFYTGWQGGAATSNIDYVLPIGPPSGAGTSVLASTSTGTMSWVALAAGGSGTVTSITAGVGLTTLVTGAITTSGTIRARRPLLLTFASGYTPATGTTGDDVVLRLPEAFEDGNTSVNWVPRRAFMRTETPVAGATRIHIEYSAGVGTFAPTNLTSGVGLTIGTGGIAETFATSFSTSSLASGTKLRVNFQTINASHTDLLIYLQLEELI